MTTSSTTTQTPRTTALSAVAGLISAGVALGVAELAAGLVGPTSAPVVAVGSTAIDHTPVALKEFAIRTFGTNDKLALETGIVVVLALLALVVGALSGRRRSVGVAGVVVLGVVGAAAAVTRPGGGVLDALPSVLGAAVGVVAMVGMLAAIARRSTGTQEARTPMARRSFLAVAGASAVGAVAAGGLGRVVLGRRYDAGTSRAAVKVPAPASPAPVVAPGADLNVKQLSPFYTPNSDFYRVDTALTLPQISTADWRLRIHGMVQHELTLTFDQLLVRDLVQRDLTLTCVSNEVGGPYVGNARWVGVPLAALLHEAGVSPDADQVLSTSADGWSCGTPVAAVMDGRDAMLAVSMNGEPLPVKHGFPVRMLVPGIYGYASATKWLVDIELTTFQKASAYWVKRGYAAKAPIKTESRIDTPRPFGQVAAGTTVPVAGVAWSQHRGIDKVEVRVDGGPWHEARLSTQDTTDTWRQFVWMWKATAGNHTLEVRATDRTGATQPEQRVSTLPDGATGWHSVAVAVT